MKRNLLAVHRFAIHRALVSGAVLAVLGGTALASPEEPVSISTVGSQGFSEKVIQASHQHPVFAEFYASWCGHCKSMEPALKEIAKRLQRRATFVRIDIDSDEALAKRLAVEGVPTIVVFDNGIALGRLRGAVPEPQLSALIDSYLE